jgi:hypothetical protein
LPRGKEPLELIRMVGRRDEMKALLSALKSRRSRLIVGPPGIGKTRLLEQCIAGWGQRVVRIEQPPVLHRLLVRMAEQLGCRSARYSSPARATSIHLKPLVLNALRAGPASVIVENLESRDPRMYRFLQELYYIPGISLIVTARSGDRIGYVRKLLWDPREKIVMKPLSRPESIELFQQAARMFRLESFDLDDFRNKVINAARGNPGQIIAMCRLATQPEYRSGRYIKFLPLRMDMLSAFVS